MEIIKRVSESYRFRALRSFIWAGKTVEVGETIEIRERAEQDGMVQRGMVTPIDIPQIATYISLGPLKLPGREQAFECKRLQLIELTREQAIQLMLERAVIPKSESQWRPGNRHLKKESKR